MRFKIIHCVIIIGFIILGLKLFYMQVLQGDYFYKLSTHNRIRVLPLEGYRGRIYDRNGHILADNRIVYDVMVTPQDVRNLNEVFDFLSEVLEIDIKILQRSYRKQKYAPFAPVTIVEDIDKKEAILIEENRFRFSGLIVYERFKRFYPNNHFAAHVLGYVGRINRTRYKNLKKYGYSQKSVVGYSGIEEYYDSYLKGEQGGIQVEVNSRGQQVRILGIKDPNQGKDITLTLDKDLQEMSERVLGRKPGAIIIMDLSNGEILTMASAPSYDPNIFLDKSKPQKVREVLHHKLSPMLNRGIHGSYPPGSVFKLIMAVAGLDMNKITEHTLIKSKGYFDIGGTRFGCTAPPGEYDLRRSLSQSCNVFYYKLGLKLRAKNIHHYAKRFGLGSVTHIDLPNENKGYIPSPRNGLRKKKWYKGNTLNYSIGQGDVLTTPIQLVSMVSIIANDGDIVRPHLLKDILGKRREHLWKMGNIGINNKVFVPVKHGMRLAIDDYAGTAHFLDLEGVYVAGKTGTAQSSPNKKHHAWFVGYVKSSKRNFVICVFLEHGGSSHNATLLGRKLFVEMKDRNML